MGHVSLVSSTVHGWVPWRRGWKVAHDHGICVDLARARLSSGAVDDGIFSAMLHYSGLVDV